MNRDQAFERLHRITVSLNNDEMRAELGNLVRDLTPGTRAEQREARESNRHHFHRRWPWKPCYREIKGGFCWRCVRREITGKNRKQIEHYMAAEEERAASRVAETSATWSARR